MKIGFDFDNTINTYSLAVEVLATRYLRLCNSVSLTKVGLQNYLLAEGREVEWTWFQGELYGPGMRYAKVQLNALEVLKSLKSKGHTLHSVSHRTIRPQGGQEYNLHKFAKEWIETNLNAALPTGANLIDEVYFLPTLDEKVRKVRELGCHVFMDDLPIVLLHHLLPSNTKKILYDWEGIYDNSIESFIRIGDWKQLEKAIGLDRAASDAICNHKL